MTALPRVPALAPETDLLAAQRMACAELVGGCERALLAVRRRTGEATSPGEVRAGLLAADLLEQVLADWRAALLALQGDGAHEVASQLLRRVHPR